MGYQFSFKKNLNKIIDIINNNSTPDTLICAILKRTTQTCINTGNIRISINTTETKLKITAKVLPKRCLGKGPLYQEDKCTSNFLYHIAT